MAELTPDDVYGDPETSTEEPRDAQPWLDLIDQYEKSGFKDFNQRADNVDKLFADAEHLASIERGRQFQIFWANIQVLGPSVYARTPVPVVVPRFRERDPLKRLTAELLERCAVIGFEQEDINGLMIELRDDLVIQSRAVPWLRYESDGKGYLTEKVCYDYVNRRDFAHDPARTWREVDWVGKRSWLTKKEMKKRFPGSDWESAAFEIRKDGGTGKDDGKLKAGVWEIWSKSANRVVWVTEGVEEILESGEPHLELDGFFPCPEPAYATTQRGSLVPVQEFLFYKDQVEEINALTNRIAALSEALKLKGFYPAGAGEIGDAIESAIRKTDDRAILVPISNWAMLGTGAVKDTIVWLPVEQIAKTVGELVELRKQLIEDVYQIMGISDIMRGSTEPSETLGAQELKSQYGSIRVRDKQSELVRVARDMVCIAGEIMAENFSPETLLAMSQMQIPGDGDIAQQVQALMGQKAKLGSMIERAQSDPRVQQAIQQNPEQGQKILQQAQQQLQQIDGQIEKLQAEPTIEKVMALLRDQRIRPFALDIETDSTIAPDENAQKQRATEYITAVGGYLNQALPLVQMVPEAATMIAEHLKYVASQFRAGRELQGVTDEFADTMKQAASRPKPPSPEQQKAQADAQAMQMKLQMDQAAQKADEQAKAADEQRKQQGAVLDEQLKRGKTDAEVAAAQRVSEEKIQTELMAREQAAQAHTQEMQKGQLELRKLAMQIRQIAVQTRATVATTQAKAAAASEGGEGSAVPTSGDSPPAENMPAMPAMDFPGMDFDPDFEAKAATALANITSLLQQVAATQAAPVEIVRDNTGNPVGVNRGGQVRQITRDPATGEIVGLQ